MKHTLEENRTIETGAPDDAPNRQAARTRSGPGRAVAGLTAALLLLTAGSARATDGFWVGRGAQAYGQAIWGGVANWLPSGQIATGAGGTAYFTNTFVNGYNVTYNVTRTIGNIWFTDPADANDFFILDQLLVMTLQGSSSAVYPTINVTQPDRALTICTVIAGNNGLAKIGAGTLILTNANTYTGLTVVSNGTLKLASAIYGATALFINGGATNVVLVTSNNNGQLTIPGSWTNADNSVQIIDYGLTTPTTTVAPLSVTNWVLGANLSLKIIGGPFLNGRSYPLVTWAGGTGPANAAVFSNAFTTLVLPPGIGGNFSVANNNLYFNVTAAREPLTWDAGSGVWDTITPNWLDANLAPATYTNNLDLVVFDDASGATGDPTLTLNNSFSPVSVTMKSTNHNYTLSGSGGLVGANSLTLDAANTQTLTLATTNTYTGNTTINAGTLKLGAANVLPNGPGLGGVTLNTGAILDLNTFSVAINSLNGGGVVDTIAGGSPVLAIGTNNANSVFTGVFQNTAGTLNLVKYGTGQLVLNTPNTFTGTVTVNGGTLTLGDPNALSTVTGLTLAGGTALLPNMGTGLNAIINAPITLGPSGTTSMINGDKPADATLTLNGPITGAGNLTFQGECVSGNKPYIVLNAQSTYTGNTLITCDVNGNAGLNLYVQLGTNNALPATTVLTLDGLASSGQVVALDLNGFNQTLSGLSNVPETSRLQQILNSSTTPATLTVSNLSDFTFSGQLGNATSGNFGLIKTGVGTLSLTGTNAYSGPTAVNAGKLVFSTGGAVATDITVATGATNGLIVASAGAQWANPGSLTQANNSMLYLNYGRYLPSTIVAPMQVANLTLGTGLTLQISGIGFVAGQSYPLLTWAGSGPSDASGFTTLVQPAQANGNLSVSGSTLYFNVTSSPEPLSWNTGNGTWDTTSTNWLNATLIKAVYTDTQDLVLFDDASGVTGNPAVTLNSGLSPLGVTMKSSSHDYTLSGTGGIAGSAALTLDAANTRTLTLATVNAYTGPTTVNGGTLYLSGTIRGSSLTISNTATFSEASTGVIAGSGVTFTQNNSGTNLLTGANTYTGGTTITSGTLQLGDGTSGHDGTIAGSPTVEDDSALVYNLYGNSTYSGTINGPGTVTKNGPGTLILTNQNSYTGNTTINGGELVGVTSGYCINSVVTVASPSATLGIAPVDNYSSWQCSTLTFAAAGTLDFNFGSVTPSPASAPSLLIYGDLDFTATPTVIVRGTTIGSSLTTIGSYPLASWSGALNGTAPTNVTLPPGMAGNLTVNGNELMLNITTTTAQPFFWATNSGVWDISISTNWIDASGVAQAYQQNTSGGEAVVFNDAASGTGPGLTVTLATNVAPVSVTFSNVVKNFNFSGPGSITGSGSVTQVGASTNTFATTNSYTGPTTVSAGTLQFQGNGALSSGSPVSLGSATLRVRRDGTGSNGTIAQGNSITLSVVGSIDTIDVGNNGSANTNNTVAFGALNNGTPANAFSSTFNFTGANGYKLSFSSLSLAGLTGNNTTLNPTTTSVIITGDVMNQEYGTVSGHYDTIFLGGTSVGNAINGTISDNANYASVGNGDTRVTMSGTGIWALRGNSTYHGPTLISAGTLEVDSSTALGVSAVTMGGGTLSNNVSATLANSVTLSSAATIGVGSGQTLTLSGVVSSTGTLTKNGAGTLSLTGANTYSGSTTVSVGTLQIGGSGKLNGGNYAGAIALSSGATLEYSSSAAQTLSGIISGAGSLVKDTSSGTLTFSGAANTFTGGITVNAGTLDIQHPFLGSLFAVVVASGAVLQLDVAATNQVGALVLNGVSQPNGVYNSGNSGGYITGSGSLLVGHQDVWLGAQSSEWSTHTLSPSKNWMAGGFSTDYADGDPVMFDDTLTGTSTIDVSVTNVLPASVTFNNSKTNYTLQGSAGIAGPAGLTKSGTGTVTIASSNSYTGATTLSAGTLQFQGSGALPGTSAISPSGTATLQIRNNGTGNNGTIALGNNITLSAASTTVTNDVGNNGSGNTGNTVAFGALNNGTTANALSSTINFTGANGYLQSFSSLGLSGSTGNGTTLNPTTTSVIITGNVTNQESGTVTGHYDTLTLSGASTGNAINGVIADNVNYASVGNGDTRITKSGTSAWALKGNNTYHGPTTISAGILEADSNTALGASVVTMSGGTLSNNVSATLANTVSLSSATTVGVGGGQTLTLSGALTNTGTLSKTGAGTLALTGANTYTGATTVNAGTLQVNNATGSGTGTGAVSVNSGGTLGGTGAITGAVTVNSGGTLSPGASVGTLTSGGQTWNGGAAYRLAVSSATNSAGRGLLSINGTLNVQATAGNPFTIKLVSMATANTPGLVADFNGNTSYTWVVATASGGILNFTASEFAIDSSGFSNALSGAFSVAVQANSLVVNYTVLVPAKFVTFGPLSGTSFPMTFSGPSGQTYEVLTSTNAALPLAGWTVLSSGTFGASPVAYTDTSATNAYQFYHIKSP